MELTTGDGPLRDDRPPRELRLVVGFDDSESARRALAWGADLLRGGHGTLHVIYADGCSSPATCPDSPARGWIGPATRRPPAWPRPPLSLVPARRRRIARTAVIAEILWPVNDRDLRFPSGDRLGTFVRPAWALVLVILKESI
jgi:hypothetical protein